jgi:RimJ/RimL family protein N-acetyltransferase
MARVMADPVIHRHLNGGPETEAAMAERYAFLQRGWSRDGTQRWWTWILTTIDGETIGFVESTIEAPERFYIGYALNPAHWRQGYGREAAAAVVDLVFERFEPGHCLIEMDVDNAASIALAESLGFPRVDTVDGEHVYRLHLDEWRARGGSVLPPPGSQR